MLRLMVQSHTGKDLFDITRDPESKDKWMVKLSTNMEVLASSKVQWLSLRGLEGKGKTREEAARNYLLIQEVSQFYANLPPPARAARVPRKRKAHG